ncbi:MAG: HAD family hydrolase [Anaerolineae bacterium]|jgi:putative hydrolase of the HAD superfamily
MLDLIAFDADDTLWHNESLYATMQDRFCGLLAPYGQDGQALAELYQTEMRNLPHYGYGIKSFGLSMIESAIRLTERRISAAEIEQIVGLIKEMTRTPVRLLDGVSDAVAALAASHPLMLITKGDLLDQERKLAQSGLAPHFSHVEIVSKKSVDVYRSLLARHGIAPHRFLMIGNSLRSDVLPVVALGGHAVHIPYHITWAHESVDDGESLPDGYVELKHIGLLAPFVEALGQEVR